MKGVWVILVVLVFALSACAIKPKAPADLVKEARAKIKEITVAEAKAKIESGVPLVVLDVREPDEFEQGHLPKAVNIPRGVLEFMVSTQIPTKDAYVIVYCRSGSRSALATNTLRQMGYKNIVNMGGGWKAWVEAGYPVE
jgi:rhodanese-related sulfurtransferase